jgi:hypothetical protein
MLCNPSSTSIGSDYGLDHRGSIPYRGRGFFLLSLRPDRLWGPRSLPYNGPLPGGQARPGRDADHSPISSAGVGGEYLLSPQAPSMACSVTTLLLPSLLSFQ